MGWRPTRPPAIPSRSRRRGAKKTSAAATIGQLSIEFITLRLSFECRIIFCRPCMKLLCATEQPQKHLRGSKPTAEGSVVIHTSSPPRFCRVCHCRQLWAPAVSPRCVARHTGATLTATRCAERCDVREVISAWRLGAGVSGQVIRLYGALQAVRWRRHALACMAGARHAFAAPGAAELLKEVRGGRLDACPDRRRRWQDGRRRG